MLSFYHMSVGVHPVNKHALVRLGALMQLKHIQTQVGKFDTHTDGVVTEVPAYEEDVKLGNYSKEFVSDLIGKRVFFSEFKEGTKVTRDGVEYAFIKFDDIEGWEEVE
jgi:co-chaperonin GroES (HSP10)